MVDSAILPVMRTILLFPRRSANRSKDSLLAAIDDRHGFSVKFADVNVTTPEEVAELLAFWHPDGCIVNNDRLPAESFAGCPTVFHHRAYKADNPRHATIAFDEKAVAETAAHHLLSLNLASYAYVPPRTDELWSRTRERHFVHILGLNGYGVASYVHPRTRLSAPKLLARLADWLANLPRPLGVFAANDAVAPLHEVVQILLFQGVGIDIGLLRAHMQAESEGDLVALGQGLIVFFLLEEIVTQSDLVGGGLFPGSDADRGHRAAAGDLGDADPLGYTHGSQSAQASV